ncbi:MAG: hypothetical protein IJ313_10585 [Clostridia bacterium]|nr:hypothetical protein [Clostridia bacterium]
MDCTAKALEAVRNEWLVQGSPNVSAIAKAAGMPVITARRYLDGSTKHGDASKIRQLAIALGRKDIADTVKDPVTSDLSETIMAFMAEKFLLWRESNLEELEIERKARLESEKRLLAEVERVTNSKDKTVDMLLNRVKELEKDKQIALSDKDIINTEMHIVRDTKRKHDRYLLLSLLLNIASFIFIICYMLFIDAPNGNFGLIRY